MMAAFYLVSHHAQNELLIGSEVKVLSWHSSADESQSNVKRISMKNTFAHQFKFNAIHSCFIRSISLAAGQKYKLALFVFDYCTE